MLILARKEDEKIIVSDAEGLQEVEITVIEIQPNRVRLGVSAPHKHVYRKELLEQRMHSETECTNASASSS